MTLPERKLWRELRKLDLNIRRQVPIGPYIADFSHLPSRLVIELDGPLHDWPEKQQHDAAKDAWLSSQGYGVLRFRNEQALDDLNSVVEAILRTLPPRGGKGRDGGVRAEISEDTLETPPESVRKSERASPPLPTSPPSRGRGG